MVPIAALVLLQSGPVVHEDRTITFTFKAPMAQKVLVNVEGQGDLPMTKGADGVWTATTKPLRSQIYGYAMNVDGTVLLDPSNPAIKPNLIWIGNLVTVPGKPPEPWEVQDVPHGEVHHHFLKSTVVGDQRDFFVYTPPGYAGGKDKLPVLYLLHGFSDTANGWTEVGKAHVILDNLIAQKKAKPMIVVMPLGYGAMDYVLEQDRPNRPTSLENCTNFEKSLLTEVMPMVERGYRVSADRGNRAIAGLSMGGQETLWVGLRNLDKFDYIGAFSSAGLPAEKPEDVLPPFPRKDLKVLWMACGTSDGLIGFQRGFTVWLKDHGMPITTKETAGGHEWLLWRDFLVEFTGKIF